MTTEEIIVDLRQNGLTSASVYTRMERAADRLEQLSKQLEAVKKDRESFARELLELKGCYQPYRPEWVRKDPSRLEIAAMIYAAGIASNQFDLDGEANLCGDALNHTDALIAAAKEVK